MKVHLMHAARDFDPEADPPAQAGALSQDLELTTLLRAMAAGHQFLVGVARAALLSSLTDPALAGYRQRVLADCLAHPQVVRDLYELAVAAVEGEKKVYYGLFFRDSPEVILHRSIEVLDFFSGHLKALRDTARAQAAAFESEGFRQLFGMLDKELGDDYFAEVQGHLKELRFRRGVLLSAGLGAGNKGTDFVLRRPQEQSWRDRLTGSRDGFSFQIADRDENGARALAELRARGIGLVASALGQSSDHVLSFFRALRAELGFYVACLNLHQALTAKGEPVCFPNLVPGPADGGRPVLQASGLYDPCLSLHLEGRVVGNDISADGSSLLMITGANQGGKSTCLRAIGLARLMMQAGLFVPARSLRASISSGVFTHYKREEDAGMDSGKLDEELSRMSLIVDQIRPGGLLLCNESFASTNEREGTQIADEIIRALLDRDVTVVFVTHLFDLAHRWHARGQDGVLFLRAERKADGGRTFRIIPGEPLPTSYGEDVYRRIFRNENRPPPVPLTPDAAPPAQPPG